MGFSLVAAFGIISVSSIIALQIFTAAVLPSITETHESFSHFIDRSSNKIHTDINITQVVVTANSSNYTHIISVANTGSSTLPTSDFVILLNGVAYHYSCSEIYLHPRQTVAFTLENIPGTGAQRLKIITNNGIADYYEYTIT